MGKILVGVLSTLIAVSANARTQDLTITTFNIKMYGSQSQSEDRDSILKKFIKEKLSSTDLFVFEEIIDVNRLVEKVLPNGVECISYDNPSTRHQHVVVCHTDNYDFKPEPTDPDSILEEISNNGYLRPAVHTLVVNNRGETVLRLIGVHLKAMPADSPRRQEQVKAIADFVKETGREIPVVITGDFNSFPAAQTHQEADDNVLFSRIFEQTDLVEAENPHRYTYRARSYRQKFDRYWMSDTVRQLEPAHVFSVCNADLGANKAETAIGTTAVNYTDPQFYYDMVSDHCPVTLKIRVSVGRH